MKKYFLILIWTMTFNNSYSQCSSALNTFSSNINYYNATVSWNYQPNIIKYKIRYKIIGGLSWSFKNNIDSLATYKNLNNLTPLSNYLWQIRSYCDTSGLNYSQWSISDTFYTSTIYSPSITGLYTTNINYNDATVSWGTNNNANRYVIKYKNIDSLNWLFLGPIYHPNNNIIIPLLEQNTEYVWQAMAYYDTTLLMASLWSITDTFTTTTFIPTEFSPTIINEIDNTLCNNATNLSLYLSQSLNEPDIGSSEITSDGGNFNIQSLAIGDSIGYAVLNTSTQTISATLKVGVISGQDFAIINSYDNSGNLISFFSIENISGGIRISSTSPNDGNNYTNGFTSEVNLNNVFINPNINGPLNFYTNIQSEINDQFNDTSEVIINCINSITDDKIENISRFEIFDLLGRKTKFSYNSILLYKYSNGRIKKIITKKEE